MTDPRQSLGRSGEELALAYLLKAGYRLQCRNFRLKTGEIDLVMYDGPVLVFIEVRSKSALNHGTPVETVNYAKRRQIEKTARQYLARKKISEDVRCRFDVVGISFRPGQPPGINHIVNAFLVGE